MKRTNLWKFAVALIGAVVLVWPAAPAFCDTTVLRWSHPSPKRGFEPELMDWIKNEIETRTNGRVTIEVYWGGSLANFKEMAEAVKSGLADIGWISAAYHTGYGELTGVAHATSLFNPEPDPVRYMEKWYEMFDRMPGFYEDFEKSNMVPISPVYYDEYWFFSKKPIRNIEDLKGVKIRAVSEGRQVAMKAVGASPVFIGAGEMYSALEKGIIDCVSYSPDTAKRYNIHEITKYVTRTNLQPGVAYWCINLDSFKKLSWIDQKTLLRIGREAALKKAAWMAKERERALQTFRDAGLEIIDFPEADKKKLDQLDAYQEYTRKWIAEKEKKGLPARKALDLYCEIFGVENPLKQ